MLYGIAANLVFVVHALFIVFVVLGGLLVFWKPWLAWLHVPVAVYGVLIEWIGWVCPLTPLENRLRVAAGQEGYSLGFVEQYLLPLLYPGPMTRTVAVTLGALVLLSNLVIYGVFLLRYWKH